MFRVLVLLGVFAAVGAAANVRLFMKDGTYHMVREYEKLEDRVRYYSVERSEWEEIPLALTDLKRTEEEIRNREAARKEETAAIAAEDKAEREVRRQIANIPQETGVYWISGQQLKPLKQAETKAVTNKRRSVLKALSPIPIVAGKATVEMDGVKSAMLIAQDLPEFYIRLAAEERFAIFRLTPTKTARIVQKWNIIPVTKEIVEEMDNVEIFRQQIAEGLYKIWPAKPLAKGEYAVVEYTEGKGNIQVWDFAVNAIAP